MNRMLNKNKQTTREFHERQVRRAVAHLKAGILGLVFGLIFGVGLFAMTAILLIESGPNTGMHLRLLGNYFIGYTITWKGAFIGFLWAFAVGVIIGWLIGMIYNRLVAIRENGRKR
jgi:hypothetical protein